MVNSPKKSPNKYGSGHFVEIALGMKESETKRKKGKSVAPEIRVDTASSSGLNDRVDVGMSPSSLRQSFKGKTAVFGNGQSPRRTRSPKVGD